MARFVAVADTIIDGLKVPRGTVMNVPSSNADIRALGAFVDGATGAGPTTSPLYTVPRLRNTATTTGAGFVDLSTLPPYLPVTAVPTSGGSTVTNVENQLGLQMSTDTFPNLGDGPAGAIIREPVLPTANKQYD
jgi:hypothetical protein